jgi:tetratricopeptide (TPR) repeat protein
MSKRKSRRPRRSPGISTSIYRQGVREADRVLSENGVEVRSDNWQQLAMDWFAPYEPERSELARYMGAHEGRLGVAWAREVLRLEIFLQAEDHVQVIAHYEHAFSRYPRCPLVEMWVADQVFRHGGDFWRARQMYYYARDNLIEDPKPHYELGFMSYVLGDFPGALDCFNQAAALVADEDAELGARIFYNRGLVRYLVDGDRKAALADVEEALRRFPDYPQAKKALRGLKGRLRWVAW